LEQGRTTTTTAAARVEVIAREKAVVVVGGWVGVGFSGRQVDQGRSQSP